MLQYLLFLQCPCGKISGRSLRQPYISLLLLCTFPRALRVSFCDVSIISIRKPVSRTYMTVHLKVPGSRGSQSTVHGARQHTRGLV
jgi:hypothetical protein